MLMNVVQNIHDKNEKNYFSNFFNGKELAMECNNWLANMFLSLDWKKRLGNSVNEHIQRKR